MYHMFQDIIGVLKVVTVVILMGGFGLANIAKPVNHKNVCAINIENA